LLLPDHSLPRAPIYHFNDIPPKVTLDEYIELARKFGDDASPAFVNGVLDAVLKAEPLPEGKAEGPAKRPRRGKASTTPEPPPEAEGSGETEPTPE
jgi:N utilization substance protein B